MTTQAILDTGVVSGAESTDVLETTLAVAQQQIQLFQNSQAGGPVDTVVRRLVPITEQIQAILNRRRGSDGMTPVHL